MSTPHTSHQDPMTSSDQFSRMPNQSDIMTDRLDVRRLISKVKRRPGLWDQSCSEYWDRDAKKRLWEEVVELLLNKEGTTNSEKKEFGNVIQRRWKSLKSCYMREYQRLSKLKPNEGRGNFRSPYYYFDRLSFLGPATNKPPPENDGLAEPDDEIGDVDDPPRLLPWFSEPKTSRKRLATQESVHPFKRVKQEKEDEDRLFLLSLLSSYKSVPQHLRIPVQLELLQVIQRAQHNMTLHYAQVPLMVYQYPCHNPPPVFQPTEQSSEPRPPTSRPPEVVEEDLKPTTQRLVVMHKMSPPSSPSSQDSVTDTELKLYHLPSSQ